MALCRKVEVGLLTGDPWDAVVGALYHATIILVAIWIEP